VALETKNYLVQEIPIEEVESWFRPKWKGLTTQEINKCVVDTGIHVFEGDIYRFVQMLEDILQEKNA
jgi:hypothetical protein